MKFYSMLAANAVGMPSGRGIALTVSMLIDAGLAFSIYHHTAKLIIVACMLMSRLVSPSSLSEWCDGDTRLDSWRQCYIYEGQELEGIGCTFGFPLGTVTVISPSTIDIVIAVIVTSGAVG